MLAIILIAAGIVMIICPAPYVDTFIDLTGYVMLVIDWLFGILRIWTARSMPCAPWAYCRPRPIGPSWWTTSTC